MMFLYLEAPFAACRTFTAGWYRPTATFLTPSAVYGLLLNVAGIESRLREEDPAHDGSVPATTTRFGLPPAEIAIGVPTTGHDSLEVEQDRVFPRVQTVYQQLHNYPVGTSGKERAESCRGNKYNISPVRREFLSDVRAVIAVRDNPEFEDRITRGLRGEFNQGRYGIPFLGDNAFLLDRLEILHQPRPVRWFERVTAGSSGIKDHATRLTVTIHRADLSQTRSDLFAPSAHAVAEPTLSAWVTMDPPAPVPIKEAPKRRRAQSPDKEDQ